MKRLLTTTLAFTFLLLVEHSTYANMLVNPGFETSAGTSECGEISGWTTWGNGLGCEPWAAETGNSGLAMYGSTRGTAGVYQEVAAQEDITYIFTAHGKCDAMFDPDHRVQAKIEFINHAQEVIHSMNTTIQHSPTWNDTVLEADAPIGTKALRVVLAFSGHHGITGAYLWDNLSLCSPDVQTEENGISPLESTN